MKSLLQRSNTSTKIPVLEDATTLFKNTTEESDIHLEAPELKLQLEPNQNSEFNSDGLTSTQEVPSLFSSKPTEPKNRHNEPYFNPDLLFAGPLGDAAIPGGAVQSPDLKTIKKYLLLREQDVAILSSRLKMAQDEMLRLGNDLKEEKGKNSELNYIIHEQKNKIEKFEKEKSLLLEKFEREVNELSFHLKAKTDQVKVLEKQLESSSEQMAHLRDRVRLDIRKIGVRERELENKLEITKKDTEALLGARENRIIELKRKLDLMDFNMDLLQDQYSKEKGITSELRERLEKIGQAIKVVSGILETEKTSHN